MKIVLVNKFFYIKGGSETYLFALRNYLKLQGHEVIDFSMVDEKNYDSPYSEYFVNSVDYNGKMGALSKLKAAKNIIYSHEAKEKFERLVKETKPDLVHLHIFQHQLSPSILDVCKKYNIPTVYTAHDLKMLCLNYVMMTNGMICEECKGGKYINCAKNKCVKDSFAKSMINVVEGYVHKWRKSYDVIDAIITPSTFYRNKFIDFGIEENRVFHIPNFLEREKPIINELEDSEQYYLYFGRLSREKGVITLLKAFKGINAKLKIVGTGPIKEQIEDYIKENNINNAELLGFKQGQELCDIVGNAKAVILPSEWYENGPYTAIEALQLGRPIIGSDLGGIPELIEENGYIFHQGDVKDLKRVIEEFPDSRTEAYTELCNNSLMLFDRIYRAESHYKQLEVIYNNVVEKNRVTSYLTN